MPTVTSSTQVTNTSQISSGVIVDDDISASAAIAYSKLNLGTSIVNADISASAAIVDTKLAAITTAGKVSGAALTTLGNTPSGAGVIPAANLPVPQYKNGTATKNAADASTTQNIAHGLSLTPKFVRLTFMTNPASALFLAPIHAVSVYNGTTQSTVAISSVSTTNDGQCSIDTTLYLNTSLTAGVSSATSGVITFDGTNIIITWTKTGSPTGTYTILWEAYA